MDRNIPSQPHDALDSLEAYNRWSRQVLGNRSPVDKETSSGQGPSDHVASSSDKEHTSSQSKKDTPSSSSRDSKVESPNSSRHDSKAETSDHLEIQQNNEIHHKIDEIKDIFSNNENVRENTQKNLIKELKAFTFNEIKEAQGWINIAKQFSDRLSTSRSKAIYDVTKELLREMPVNLENDKLEDLFSNNEIDRKEVENNFIRGLTAHFKQELQAAKELFEWAKTFTKPFGSDEKWVQDGIKQQLAIAFKKSQIESDKPSMANAKLLQENIREALKDGIPVKDIPKSICGRKVTGVSGEGNDCLIRALLKGAKPEYSASIIENKFQYMRQFLIDKGIVEEGVMLDLRSEQGKNFIKYMENKGYLRQGRNLLVYQYRDGKIQCISMIDKGSNKPPYAVLLNDAKKHFYAIEVPQKG